MYTHFTSFTSRKYKESSEKLKIFFIFYPLFNLTRSKEKNRKSASKETPYTIGNSANFKKSRGFPSSSLDEFGFFNTIQSYGSSLTKKYQKKSNAVT